MGDTYCMSKTLLQKYIKLAMEEARSARVPQQLLEPTEQKDGTTDEENEQDIQEFSGVGAIAGFAAPLGAAPKGRNKGRSKVKK